jgi:hypothetical protein
MGQRDRSYDVGNHRDSAVGPILRAELRMKIAFRDGLVHLWEQFDGVIDNSSGQGPAEVASTRSPGCALSPAGLVMGFGCRPFTSAATGAGAGVRKPPGKEPAEYWGTVAPQALRGFGGRGGRRGGGQAVAGSVLFTPTLVFRP